MSLTIGGILVSLLGTLLVKFGFTEACTSEIVQLSPLAVGSIMAWIGRVRVGDISIFGVRKV